MTVCGANGCRKKIKIIDELISQCRCGEKHCSNHRLPETHKCEYDFTKSVSKVELIEKMKCVTPKLNKI
jgi:hypothetical protein